MAGLTAAELEAVVSVDSGPFGAGLDKMLGMFEGWGGKAGKIMAGVGATGGTLFAAGVVSGMGLEDARARFESELGVTEAKAAELGDVAGKVYAGKFGSSMEEVQAAVSVVVSSIKGMRKASDAEVQAMTERALTFADVFGVDVARAAQVAGGAVRVGLARDATQAFDLLTTTMQRVPTQVREDVLDATDEYGQFFASLGIGGEEAFTLLANSAAKGMFGIDKTGDALKEFTIRSTDMSASSKDAYKVIGLGARDMTNDLLAGGDRAAGAFDKIVEGLVGIKDPAKQSATTLALFGTPLEDLGVKDMPKFLRSLQAGKQGLGDFEGATDRMSEAMGSTASANLGAFWRGLKQATVGALGGVLIPYVTTAASTLYGTLEPALSTAATVAGTTGRAFSALAGFVQENQTPLAVIAGLIGAVLLPMLVGMAVQSAATAAMSVASWLAMQAAAIRSAAASVAASWRVVAGWVAMGAGALASLAVSTLAVAGIVAGWVLMGAQSLLGAAKVAAAWFIALGPIGWAIAAIAGVVALVVVYWDQIKAATAAVWGWVVGKVKWAANFAVMIFRNFTLPGLIIKHWDTIKRVTGNAVGAVVGFVKSLPGKMLGVLASLGGLLRGLFTRTWDGVATAVTGGIGRVVGLVKGLPGKLLNAGGALFNAGKTLIGKFLDGLKALGGIAASVASNLMSAIVGPINGAIGSINAAIPNKVGIGKFSIDLPDNPFPTIPGFATGARVTGPTYAMIGEGKEAETVLPDSVLRGLLEDVHTSGARSGRRDEGNGRGPLVGEVNFNGERTGATARELMTELTHALRVADYGGVYA